MSTIREAPNPYRPYIQNPSVSIPPISPSHPFPPTNSSTHGLGLKNSSAASYASSARDIFSDIDYSDYLSESSTGGVLESAKALLNEAFTQYAGVLCGQPFEIAKLVLQVRRVDGGVLTGEKEGGRDRRWGGGREGYDEYNSEDSDPDEPAYFTSTAPSSHSYNAPRSRRRRSSDDYNSKSPPIPKSAPTTHQLLLKKSDSIMEVLSQEWSKEGAWGVWKGSNPTFVYLVLQKTVESWSRSLLSAIFNLPEPATLGLSGRMDIVDAPYPWATLGVAVAAGALAGLILAPLDLVRTKLILTPTSTPRCSLLQNLRSLPSYICPPTLLLPTTLHSLIHPLREYSTPLLLRNRFSIDPILTPTTHTIFTFLSRTLEIFIKLPIETVLRRGQASIILSKDYVQASSADGREVKTIVETGTYKGIVGTMWNIVWEEGKRGETFEVGKGVVPLVKKRRSEKKGQGVAGLWRGWRVGMWGLVGLYISKGLAGSGGGGGGEF